MQARTFQSNKTTSDDIEKLDSSHSQGLKGSNLSFT